MGRFKILNSGSIGVKPLFSKGQRKIRNFGLIILNRRAVEEGLRGSIGTTDAAKGASKTADNQVSAKNR
jgi:hypothetical protein